MDHKKSIKKNKNKLYYYEATYGTIFYDQNNVIIDSIHENDGQFRSEYFTQLFTHFDIEVKCVPKRPKFLTDEILIKYGIE